MAKAESLGVTLELSYREAKYLHAITGQMTGYDAKQVANGGDGLNVAIYEALTAAGVRGYGEEF